MNKYDIHQTRWAHDCALAIDAIVPLDGPSMARVEAALLERWPVPQGWALVPQEPTGAMKRAAVEWTAHIEALERDAARWRSLEWHWEPERDMGPGGRYWTAFFVNKGHPPVDSAYDAMRAEKDAT